MNLSFNFSVSHLIGYYNIFRENLIIEYSSYILYIELARYFALRFIPLFESLFQNPIYRNPRIKRWMLKVFDDK